MIDEERIREEIDAAMAILEKLDITLMGGCPCGCVALASSRTGKAQQYESVDHITYHNVLGFAGPAFRQLVSRTTTAGVAGQTTFNCFIEAVAIVRSCVVDACTSTDQGPTGPEFFDLGDDDDEDEDR